MSRGHKKQGRVSHRGYRALGGPDPRGGQGPRRRAGEGAGEGKERK